MKAGLRLSKEDSPSKSERTNFPYSELVGSLLWTSLICHPEIAFSVGQLTCFNSNPGQAHWEAAKRVLRYLKGVKDHTLELGGAMKGATELTVYSDADYAGDVDDRRSTSGYVIKLGKSTISWSSKKQTTVATSSTEA